MHRDFHFTQNVKTTKNDIIRKIVQRIKEEKKQNMPILTLILEYNEFWIREYDNKNNVCTKKHVGNDRTTPISGALVHTI